MSEIDILSAIGGDKADPVELEQVLLWHFGGSTQPSDDTILYGKPDISLELKYSNAGRPISLKTGPAFKPSDQEKLKSALDEQVLAEGPLKIARTVLFGRVPVAGWFRFGDEFQILPVPPEAPRPEQLVGEHPCMLEVAYHGSTGVNIDVIRRMKRVREIELQCALLLVPYVHAASTSVSFHWVLDFPGGDISAPSRFLQAGYQWPGANVQSETFSATADFPAMAQCNVQAYYASRGVAGGDVLQVPANLSESLGRIGALSAADRKRFLRAAYWYQQSFKVWSTSRSLAFTALVSAIEAMCPPTPQGGRIQQTFIDFVERHASGIPERDRKRLYGVRSAISHGGKLLHADEVAWGLTLQSANEYNDLRLLSSIVRAVLINWLYI